MLLSVRQGPASLTGRWEWALPAAWQGRTKDIGISTRATTVSSNDDTSKQVARCDQERG